MRLRKYDGQCVRITDIDGNVFEGICAHNSADYDEHEFGNYEESLQILSFIFYKSGIEKIESLEKVDGPYGCFSEPFGKLEEMIVEDGADSIDDAVIDGEEEHVIRILRCIEKYIDDAEDDKLKDRAGIAEVMRKLAADTEYEDEEIRQKAAKLAELIGSRNDENGDEIKECYGNEED
ncbi:MAG: hypothetical protein J5950_02290 [Clostridia bacterium]|nr:hypothetical protein [Clostridia bacterium]